MSFEQNSLAASEFFEKGAQRALERFKNADVEGAVADCIEMITHIKDNFTTLSCLELTEYAGRLALLKPFIGTETARAMLNTNNSYIYKTFQKAGKRKYATERLREKGEKYTVGDLDAEVIKMSIREEQDWAFNQEYADRLKTLLDSISTIVSALGWRIKELSQERFESRVYDTANTDPKS